MLKKLFVIGLLFCLAKIGISQTANLDSMKMKWLNEKNDSLQLSYALDYGAKMVYQDSTAAHKIFNDVFEQANTKGFAAHAASAKLELGILYYVRGNYIRSIATNEIAEQLFTPLPESNYKDISLAAIYNNQGALYSLINELEKAQEYYFRSIELYGNIPDSAGLTVAWFNVAFLYIDIQEWKKAAEFLQRSMDCYDGKNKTDNYIETLARKAAMHFRLGEVEKGKSLLQKARANSPTNPSLLTTIYLHNAEGEYYASTGNRKAALQAHQKGYVAAISYEDPYYLVDQAWEIGRSFLSLNQKDSASKYLRNALQQARQYNYLPKVKFILSDLSTYYASTAQYEQAYYYSSRLNTFTDSLVTLQNHNRILLNDARYESAKKEGRISELEAAQLVQDLRIKQKNTLNYVLIGAAITMLIIGGLSYRNYRQKQTLQQQRIAELETEKQLLAADAVMKGEEQERSRLAKDLHDGLGGMLSGIKHSFQHMKDNLIMTPDNQLAFERSMDMLDSSIKELRRVAHNMMPESLMKFGLEVALKDFCNAVQQSGALQISFQSLGLENREIDKQISIGVYRIVQELINNTLKHASATKCIVQLSNTTDGLTITVEDNGKGFDGNLLTNSGGMGWNNIRSRIDYLKGKLDVQTAPGEGTSVLIEIPI